MARLRKFSGFKRHRAAALFVLLSLPVLRVQPAEAETETEKQLKFDYLDKVLTLRHFYSDEHLKFSADGSLQGDAEVGPWTVYGQLLVSDVRLRGSTLLIKGRRLYLTYDAKSRQFQDRLPAIRDYSGKDWEELAKFLRKQEVEIEIELPPGEPSGDEISSAMKAVFLAPGESMVGIAPDPWRNFFERQENKPLTGTDPGEPIYRVASQPGGVSPPRTKFDPEPEYSEEARKLKYQGVLVLNLVVDSAGKPVHIQILNPLGLGLDEKAVAAVSTWKFSPAQKDGEPVAVMVNIEVNFHLY